MDSSEMNFENLIELFNEDLSAHPLLKSFKGKPELIYASLYFFVCGEELCESDVKIGLSLELISLSYRLHFLNSNMSSLDLITGDYFYARALKRTVEVGKIDAVKVLSRAVSREASLRSSGFRSNIFPSLIAAACELSVLRGRPSDSVKRSLEEFLKKRMRGFAGLESGEEAACLLKDWGWLD
jgi:hypothetical protein